MKVVIVSDSHGNMGVLKRIVQREAPFELLFHLGDGIEEAFRLQKMIGFNLDGVEGNNDLKGIYPTVLTLKLGKIKCFFTHGHLFEVHRGLAGLAYEAKKSKANLAFFGHTHCCHDELQKGVRLLNPGSVCNYLTKEAGYLVLQVDGREFQITKNQILD